MAESRNKTDQEYLVHLREKPYINLHGGPIGTFVAPDRRYYQFNHGREYIYALCYEDHPVIIRMVPRPDAEYWRYKNTIYPTAQQPLRLLRECRRIFPDIAEEFHVKRLRIADGEVHVGRPKYMWEKDGYGRGVGSSTDERQNR